MALTLHLPADTTFKTARRAPVSDATVAMIFAVVPVVLFVLAIAMFGFNPVLDFAAASIG